MKNYLKTVVLFATAAIWFAGCKKDENRNFFLGGKNSVISANKSTVVLTKATEQEDAITFRWTNPDYVFSTGLSSQDVQYAMEFDVNSAFNTSKKYVTTISKDLSKTFKVVDLNSILGNSMGLFDQDVTIYVRIKSSLRFEGSVNGELVSNTISFNTRPFAPPPAVVPPATNKLVLVGGASPGGWDNAAGNTQVFTRVTNTLYEITIKLTGGGSVLFLPVPGSWDLKYGFDGGNNTNNVNGDKLKLGGGDVKVPAATGNYKITVNFQSGVFTITPQ